MRDTLSVLAGIATGFIVISLVEMGRVLLFPPPSDFAFTDKEALKVYLKNAPVEIFLFKALAWSLGSFSGGLITSLIAKGRKIESALITGIVLLIAGLINLITIPHPVWFWIIGLAVYLPCAYLGGKLGSSLFNTTVE